MEHARAAMESETRRLNGFEVLVRVHAQGVDEHDGRSGAPVLVEEAHSVVGLDECALRRCRMVHFAVLWRLRAEASPHSDRSEQAKNGLNVFVFA